MELKLDLNHEERDKLAAGLASYQRLHKTGWLNEEEYACFAEDEFIAQYTVKNSIVSVEILLKMKDVLNRILNADWASLALVLTPQEETQFEAVFQAHRFVRKALRVLDPS